MDTITHPWTESTDNEGYNITYQVLFGNNASEADSSHNRVENLDVAIYVATGRIFVF